MLAHIRLVWANIIEVAHREYMLSTTVPRPLCNSTGHFAAVQNAEALLCSLTLFGLPYHSFVFVHIYLPESQLSHIIIDHVRIANCACGNVPINRMFIGRTASTITFQSDRSCVGSLLRSNTPAIQRCFRRVCA